MSSMSSTPHKKSSTRTSRTASTPPISRAQSELLKLVAEEIDDQTYEFPPDQVARMMSPKLLQIGKTSSNPPLKDFDCLIDQPVVQDALESVPELRAIGDDITGWDPDKEKSNYAPVAKFLNKCTEECDKLYDTIYEKLPLQKDSRFDIVPRSQRWLPNLRFVVYDKPTGDGIDEAQPLKPDFVGVDDVEGLEELNREKIKCWWSLPEGPETDKRKAKGENLSHFPIVVAGEVKNNWKETVRQSGTYARGLFSASPLRSFALVIAVNHKQQNLRFLIFHHGGLSASHLLELGNANDCRAILKIMLSILLWQSPEDAGLPPFTDGYHFKLPYVFEDMFKVDSVIHQSSSIRGRNTYVARLMPPQDDDALNQSDNPKPESAVTPATPRYPFRRTAMRIKRSREKSRTQSGSQKSPRPNLHSGATKPTKSQSRSKQKRLGSSQLNTLSPNLPEGQESSSKDADEEPPEPVIPRDTRPRSLNIVKPSRVIPANTDNVQPKPFSSPIIVKCSWPSAAKEEMEPKMYEACEGVFGAPQFLFSFVPCFRDGQPMSNSIFLPSEGEDCHWPLFRKDPPKEVDHRTIWVTVLASEGQTLEECENASDLCECLLHAMLGWLMAYSKGYMHRDISIGNLLKLLKPRVSPTGFNAVKSLENLSRPPNFALPLPISVLAKKLDEALKPYNVVGGNACKGIFTDGDMAAYIPTYFDNEHDDGGLSGTTEFMSTRLLYAAQIRQTILQCPVDDLWSFFWTTLWATLFNRRDPGKTEAEVLWRKSAQGDYPTRDGIANLIRANLVQDNVDYSVVFRKMKPLLREWYKQLEEVTSSWELELQVVWEKSDSPTDILIMFHKYAYKGVLDFVDVLTESGLLGNK